MEKRGNSNLALYSSQADLGSQVHVYLLWQSLKHCLKASFPISVYCQDSCVVRITQFFILNMGETKQRRHPALACGPESESLQKSDRSHRRCVLGMEPTWLKDAGKRVVDTVG